jgi:uncharacterized membrane protein (UPF0127 family)
MKKKLLLLLPLLILATFILLRVAGTKEQQPTQQQIDLTSIEDRSLIDATLSGKQFRFEIVNSYASQLLGLSNREEIGSDGMLFVFHRPDKHQIWMKDMTFNLDLIWLRGNMVVDLILDVPKPKPDQELDTLPIYQPIEKVDMLLEVKAGFVNEHHIEVGDELIVINN